MKSPIRKFFGFAVFAICLAACASNRAASPAGVPPTVNPATFTAALPSPTATQTKLPPIRMTDGLGTEVSLPGPASRIVSLGPSNTEILFAIGAEDLIVGADLSSDYPEEAKSLASISASSYGTLDVESIKALEPDLVLAAEILSSDQVQGMRSLG
jgi:iron complex transport system substrate-binding protein